MPSFPCLDALISLFLTDPTLPAFDLSESTTQL
jgi:hypothetical protein